MKVMIDNQAAIKQMENEATSSTAKHVDLQGVVKAEFIDTKSQLVDLFTKILPAPRLAELRGMIGMK
ncbi:Copia protein [Phytophthora megakarya]|uniref:Copia protein n=1 Tax=Phytophthora megakarya TaxID=4795 RepID=A0A225UVD6_9STRA|nr:Copia protein [Phytophthora megakarya]